MTDSSDDDSSSIVLEDEHEGTSIEMSRFNRNATTLTSAEVLDNTLAGGMRRHVRNKSEPHRSRSLQISKEEQETIYRQESLLDVDSSSESAKSNSIWANAKSGLKKYGRFAGGSIMVSVAYMDPGNYATAVSGGAQNQFSLLTIVLFASIIAIFMQALCVKLGSVTGVDLSRNCRRHLPPWMNYTLWILAELMVIATDIAEVIGTAIALNVLIKVPLPAGVVLTLVDVFFVLLAYKPGSSLRFVRAFEFSVAVLVLVVVVCFCVELSYLPKQNVGHIFRGFVPSQQMFSNGGVYTAASILGATVMPHSLFLGSGSVQPRLRDYDIQKGYVELSEDQEENEENYYSYSPSLSAINYSMRYSVIELVVTLLSFAMFVNAAILIVAGSTLYGTDEAYDADLYTIHSLLFNTVSPAAATIFMVALLASGQSAGIVCTIAGQMVSEGHLNWTCKPWIRRLITRSISIVPCLIISLSIKREGLNKALNASQVVLSFMLPFLTAPLIYFTCNKRIMRVEAANEKDSEANGTASKDMSNNWFTTVVAVTIWLFISVLNVYAIYQAAKDGI